MLTLTTKELTTIILKIDHYAVGVDHDNVGIDHYGLLEVTQRFGIDHCDIVIGHDIKIDHYGVELDFDDVGIHHGDDGIDQDAL